jgi:hypothetical protein
MAEREPFFTPRVLKFGEGLLIPTLKEEKQITLRKYRPEAHQFKKDELFTGIFEEGINVWLHATADTEVKTFGELTDEEAREDGFLDAADAFEKMKKYYPDLTSETKLGIIRFDTVAIIKGMPAITINKSK